MVFDSTLADRIRKILGRRRGVAEKKMFGGLSFLVNGKMAVGILGEDLVVRMDADQFVKALKKPHTRPMDFTGRPMKGWLYVAPKGTATEKALSQWVECGLAYAGQIKK